MKPVIEVSSLRKTFADGIRSKRVVLKDLQFRVHEGLITGFVGANGSGKTTTLKCLLKFIFPDPLPNLKMQFFDQTEFGPQVQKRLGYWPEKPYLPEQLTAREFLKLHFRLGSGGNTNNDEFTARFDEVMRRMELEAAKDRRLRNFSKGMMQRAGLAQALLCRPDLLILDEPMSGLDPDGRWLVKQILREENKRGVSILFSSHLLADMDELCSELVVIDQGEILFNGPVAEFTSTGIEITRNIEEAFARRLRERRGQL